MLTAEDKMWIDAKLKQLHECLGRADRIMAEEAQLKLLIQQARAAAKLVPSRN